MAVKTILTKTDFDQALKDAGSKAVVVDFTATWCGPCKMIGPKFEAMASEFTSIVCLKVDVDENSDTAEACGISAMPTFQAFVNSEKVAEVVGASEDKLKEMMVNLQ